jgi:hypothetical protein
MATALTIITRAMRLAGVFTKGTPPDDDEAADGLDALNTMLDSMSLERLFVYQLLQESKALTSSVGSYTIGSGGAFNTTRPTKIVDPCFVRDSGNNDTPLIILNAEQYGRIVGKTVDGSYPQYLFYDGAYVSGLATIFLYPEPAASLTLYINSLKQLQQFTALTTEIALPPGYKRMLEYNLAVEFGPEFDVDIPDRVERIAAKSRANLKAINGVTPVLSTSMVSGGLRANIFTG